MKLDCVLTACNDHPLYINFIPLFIRTWKKLYPNVDVKIIVIADKIPDKFLPFKNFIILFNPIPGVSTSFTSQYIRILYPSILNYKNGILITDIDILPMNRTYYTKNIEKYDDDKFIAYREESINIKEIMICYNVALNKTWSEIFNINSVEDIRNRLSEVFSSIKYVEGHGKDGWTTDQLDLYKYVMKWNEKTNNFIGLLDNETGYKRLCRRENPALLKDKFDEIKSGKYSDYHCYRPYDIFIRENEVIFQLL